MIAAQFIVELEETQTGMGFCGASMKFPVISILTCSLQTLLRGMYASIGDVFAVCGEICWTRVSQSYYNLVEANLQRMPERKGLR